MRRTAWPRAAVLSTVGLALLVITLLAMNLLGLELRRAPLSKDSFGSLAEWVQAFGSVVAVPLALWVGVRQLASSREQTDVQRAQLSIDQADHDDRRRWRESGIRGALNVTFAWRPIVDATEFATDKERVVIHSWVDEMNQRGWSRGVGEHMWSNSGQALDSAQLYEREPSKLLKTSWVATLRVTNGGQTAVDIRRLRCLCAAGDHIDVSDEPFSLSSLGMKQWRIDLGRKTTRSERRPIKVLMTINEPVLGEREFEWSVQ